MCTPWAAWPPDCGAVGQVRGAGDPTPRRPRRLWPRRGKDWSCRVARPLVRVFKSLGNFNQFREIKKKKSV